MKLRALNTREVKQIHQIMKNQWGPPPKFKLDFAFLKGENKIFIINRDIGKIDFHKLKINSMGLYLGELKKDQLILSIEGSQLIGPKSQKNIVEVNKTQLKEWLKGEQIEATGKGFVIVKHKKDYFGCGKIIENKIRNYVPKTRRLSFIDS